VTAYDPRLPETLADPYPHYASAREQGPVVYNEVLRSWMVLGHEEVVEVLRDRTMSSEWNGHRRPYDPAVLAQIKPLNDWFARTLLFSNPPVHTRLRAVMNKAFTPRRVEELRPSVQRIVEDLIEPVAGRGAMEFVAEFAYPLPVTVIAELLGVPDADRAHVRTWSDTMSRFMSNQLAPEQTAVEANEAVVAMNAYLTDVVGQRRAEPADDLISAMVAAEDDGRYLDTDEIVVQCGLLLLAGHETTTNALALAVHNLGSRPEQLARLAAEPDLIGSAVEEVLRFDSSVQFTSRVATRDLTVGGADIRKGQRISVCFGAAGRDPARFPDPDTFHVDRNDARHAAFGTGTHYCVGAGLARMEIEVALRVLVQRLPNLRPSTDQRAWRPVVAHRGLDRLPVEWDVEPR
jgi:pimeloyl-[acyl-carrier protein] synthase